MPFERQQTLEINERVVMREGPCSTCPPWTRRFVVKGDKGRIAAWSDATRSYWVSFDRFPDEQTGLCTRHLVLESEAQKKKSGK